MATDLLFFYIHATCLSAQLASLACAKFKIIFALKGIRKVLETLSNDKSPGEDGFTAEFYKFFYELVGSDLIACFNEAHKSGELTSHTFPNDKYDTFIQNVEIPKLSDEDRDSFGRG